MNVFESIAKASKTVVEGTAKLGRRLFKKAEPKR